VDLMDAVVFLVYFSKRTQELLISLGLQPEDRQVNFSEVFLRDEDLVGLFEVYERAGSLQNFSLVNPTKSLLPTASIEELRQLLSSHHRVAVLDRDGNLENYITQSDIVKRSCALLNSSIQLLDIDKSLSELSIGSSDVCVVKDTDIFIEALKTMTVKRISSVAVVNLEGQLQNDISAYDIRGINLETQFLDRLVMPVKDYLKEIAKEAPETLTNRKTLKDVVNLFSHGAHRVYVMDADTGKPLQVITNGDFLRYLSQNCK